MTASVCGYIKSQSGEPVAGISVKLVHEPTGSAFAKSSDSSGRYSFESVKVGGPYMLSMMTEQAPSAGPESFNVKVDEVFTHDFVL